MGTGRAITSSKPAVHRGGRNFRGGWFRRHLREAVPGSESRHSPIETPRRNAHPTAPVWLCLAIFLCLVSAAQALANEPHRIFRNPDEPIGAGKEAWLIRPNEPLTRAIHSGMAARSVAALRIAEAGRKSLQEGNDERALLRFERALALDVSVSGAYYYYYLALIHYRLTRYQQALNFLDVAESRLRAEPEWDAELSALKETIRRVLQSTRFSTVKSDVATPIQSPTASVTETEPLQGPASAVSADTGTPVKRQYLFLFDLLLLSFTALVFFAALFSLPFRNLRPR